MNIIIFGTGDVYRKNKKYLTKKDNIIAFFDNNPGVQGSKIDGIQIYSPTDIDKICYEKIVIMSYRYYTSMKKQLLDLGCAREDILYFQEYISHQQAGNLKVYDENSMGLGNRKALIITSPLDYHGGAIAAIYMALALQQRGYEMAIAAPAGNEQFLEEFQRYKIIFYIYPNLQFSKWEELDWLQQYQTIVVNTYPMILCALEISKYRRTMLWLHESDIIYPYMDFWKDLVIQYLNTDHLSIYGVSDVARKNFKRNITDADIGILPYGIPDLMGREPKKDEKLRFAQIGTIHPIKCQMLFLDAIERLQKEEREVSDFLIIGGSGDVVDYVEQVKSKGKELGEVKFVEKLSRKAIEQLYKTIDVFVIASEQETMSLVATEAMMYGKVCIISDLAGMALYVKHGKNGRLFHANDVQGLTEQIQLCIHNREKLSDIGRNARITYEKYFTMKCFGDRLDKIFSVMEKRQGD